METGRCSIARSNGTEFMKDSTSRTQEDCTMISATSNNRKSSGNELGRGVLRRACQSMMVIGMAVFAASLAPQAKADQKADEKAIRDLHAKLVSAFQKKDIHAVMALAASDFSEVDSRGKTMTAKQSEEALKEQFDTIEGPMSCEMVMSKLDIKGDKATYRSAFKMSGKIVDK